MRIIYLGTPDFAVLPLEKIFSIKDCEIIGVVTNKDKPVGRKQILTPPPVKVKALEMGLPVLQYDKIREEGVQDIKDLKPDLMITCAFGQILSQEILDIPRLGVINIHASLLPKYRGASPINYAILNGEKITGITVMKTDIGIDTGDMIYSEEISIGEEETAGELFDRLSILGAECIEKVLIDLLNGKMPLIKQNDSEATYTKIIKKEMAKIDFSKSAKEVVNTIRAFNPAPIAYTYLNGEIFKIYSAKVTYESGKAGTVVVSDKRLVVACGEGGIELLKVQKCGGKPLFIKDFLAGNKLPLGTEFKC